MSDCRRGLAGFSVLALLAAPSATWAAPVLATDGLYLRPFLSGLSQPVALRHAGDGSGRLFVVQQSGSIRVVRDGVVLATPFLTLDATSTQCLATPDSLQDQGGQRVALGFASGGERGLLGLAFHPNYANNGEAFLNFTDARGDTVVARYRRLAGDADRLDPASCEIVLRVDQDFSNHNGGDLHFGPDSYLYVGLGDGGDRNDPCNRAQTLNPSQLVATGVFGGGDCAADANFAAAGSGDAGGNPASRALLGKFLRLDVDQRTAAGANALCGAYGDGSAAYALPAGNPFLGADAASACDEVWSYGWRNPWRFSFDRANGDLWVGDVGQNAVEEIDRELAGSGGGDYGWKQCEGDREVVAGGCAAPRIAPLLRYHHADGRCSIVGGYRWRGASAGFSEGRYFYADSCTSELFVASEQLGQWSAVRWLPADAGLGAFGLVAFGEDADGTLYAVDLGGRVLRLESALYLDSFE